MGNVLSIRQLLFKKGCHPREVEDPGSTKFCLRTSNGLEYGVGCSLDSRLRGNDTTQLLSSTKRKRLKQKGYTLVEIAVVLGVLTVLVSIVTPLIIQFQQRLEWSTTHKEMKILEAGLLSFYGDLGFFPNQNDGLRLLAFPETQSLSGGAAGLNAPLAPLVTINTPLNALELGRWKGPYVRGQFPDLLKDGWDNEYHYEIVPNGNFLPDYGITPKAEMSVIVSAGLNQRFDSPLTPNDDLRRFISSHLVRQEFESKVLKKLQLLHAQATAFLGEGRDYSFVFHLLSIGNVAGLVFLEPHHTVRAAQACALISSTKACPSASLVAINAVSLFQAKDPWGQFFYWDPISVQFYSTGINQVDESGGGVIGGDDIAVSNVFN